MKDKVVDIMHSLKMSKKLTSSKTMFQQQVVPLAISLTLINPTRYTEKRTTTY